MALTVTDMTNEEKLSFGRHVVRLKLVTHDGSAAALTAASVGLDTILFAMAGPGIVPVGSAGTTTQVDLTAMSAGGITFSALSAGATFTLMVVGSNE